MKPAIFVSTIDDIGKHSFQVKSLFEKAREEKPSIIFIDEVDSLVSSRSEGKRQSMNI